MRRPCPVLRVPARTIRTTHSAITIMPAAKNLAVVLKGLDQGVRQRFLNYISGRAARDLSKEMER